MHGTHEDPRLLAMASIAAAQANVDNVGKLVEDTEYYKEKMKQIKETLVSKRTKGKQLKRLHSLREGSTIHQLHETNHVNDYQTPLNPRNSFGQKIQLRITNRIFCLSLNNF